jgi:signal transduction histidine kinase
LPAVEGDPDQLSQVFQNLLENAIAYTEDDVDPQIEVSGTLDGEMLEVAVTDNGVGIDPEDAESIFEIFERQNTDTEGTGVGLAVCRRIVDRHGGEIWAEPATGRGTTFRFTLPAENSDE